MRTWKRYTIPVNLLISILILLFQFQTAFAQHYNFEFFGVDAGLAQSSIKDVFQDSKGYLWIATHGGVSKFDGKEFKNWNKDDGMRIGIMSEIAETPDGKILVGSRDGMVLFEDDQLTVLDTSDGLPGMNISTVYNNGDKIWVATNNGIAYYDNGQFVVPDFNFPKQNAACRGIAGGGDFPLYVHAEGRIYYYENGIWDSLPPNDMYIIDMIMDKEGGVWLGSWTYDQLSYWKDGEMSNYNEIIYSPVTQLFIDNQDQIWVATWDQGMFCISENNVRNLSIDNGLNSNSFWGVTKDNEGNMWFGSFGGGLVKYPDNPFVHYKKEDGLPSNVVNIVQKDSKGRLWVGTDNGLVVGKPGANDQIEWLDGPWTDYFEGQKVVALLELSNGDMAIGTYGNETRLAIYSNGQFISYYKRARTSVFCLAESKEGILYAGLDNMGVFVTGPEGDQIVEFTHGGNRVASLSFDSKEQLWVSKIGGGVNVWTKDSIYIFNEDFLESASISGCVEGFNNEQWIGTEEDGIWLVNFKNGKLDLVDSLNTKNEGISNKIIAVYKDSRGHIWAGTDMGIMKINKYSNGQIDFESFDRSDGFNLGECGFNAITELNGKIFIGTSGGITAVNRDLQRKDQNIDRLGFVGLELHYNSALVRDLSAVDEYGFPNALAFDHQDNHLSFEVRAIHFSQPDKVEYRFKMEGLDNDWSPWTNRGKITYSSLPPGDYELLIESKLAYNDEAGIQKRIQIIIHPPFWQTTWFKITAIVTILVMIILIFRWRTAKMRKQQIKLENTVTERTNELRVQKEMVEEKNQEITDSIEYAKRIQSAILPPSKLVKDLIPESFVLYKPKDIVAGDFYWLEHTDDAVYIAAADCTGHGVPGAMVSVVCHMALNRSVREFNQTHPGDILNQTRELVIKTFERSEEEVKDGMDIALVKIDQKSKQTSIIEFAGAHNPLWIVRGEEILEIKADKQPIGKFDTSQSFTNHEVEVLKGDLLYFFSDGYADQFGGDKGKKFKSANFKKLLLSIKNESLDRQKELLDEAFENWRGKLEQLDDVCVIGVRI